MSQQTRQKAVFLEALELPREQRPGFLDRACAGDPALRSIVEELLTYYEGAGAFLASPTASSQIAPPTSVVISEKALGSHIGPYKLVQLIGEGGFGSVFMAEQEHPVRRLVALKIIKMGMDTNQVIARFEHERQALAIMEHPNIARVFDAGATEAGRPYFVMELVRGEAITQHCDRNNLSVEARLDLFIQVCQAVQHAHTKGIIHRDIKPSNVLVMIADDKPIPKVIDFGIAKATSASLTEKTLFTEHRALIGTPEYMSPEQAEMTGGDIDTRSDVYSLGVLLYELLTGAPPFDPTRLRSAAFAEIQRIIREEEPVKPSTRLSALDALPSVAAHRQMEPDRLTRVIRGDLDWIVMKCLEKDRDRRYETAEGLALDVRRHLSGEPVEAAPPSRVYRVRKFVRRHRIGVLSSAAIFLALVLGIIGTSLALKRAVEAERAQSRLTVQAEAARLAEAEQARRADREAALARAEAAIAESVNRLLTDMLAMANRGVQGGNPNVTVREVMELAARRLDMGYLPGEEEARDLSHAHTTEYEPRVEAAVRETIGLTYRALGLYEEAESQFRRALELRRATAPDEPLHIVTGLRRVAMALRFRGCYDEAEPLARDSLDLALADFGPEHEQVALSMLEVAMVLRSKGQRAEAERVVHDTLAMLGRIPGSHEHDRADCLSQLAGMRSEVGDYDAAEAMHREALALRRQRWGDVNPAVASSLANLAASLIEKADYNQAEIYEREALAMIRHLYGDEHPAVATGLNNLATVIMRKGDLAMAETMFLESLDMRRRLLGDRHPNVAVSLNNLAGLYLDRGEYQRAEPLLEEALPIYRQAVSGEHPDLARMLNGLSLVQYAKRDFVGSEASAREAVEICRRLLPDDHPMLAVTLHHWAQAMTSLGRSEEAIGPAREAVGIYRKRSTGYAMSERYHALQILEMLVQDSEELNEVAGWYREFIADLRPTLAANDPFLARVLLGFAFLYMKQETPEAAAESEPLLRECHAIREQMHPTGHPEQWRMHNVAIWLGAAITAQGRFAEAEPILMAAYEGIDPPRHALSRKRAAIEEIVRLYDAWHAAEPQGGYDAKAAQWRSRLAEHDSRDGG